MNETLCIGIDLARINNPQARWNRVAALLRQRGARQVGGLFEFEDADPDHVAALLDDWLDPDDRVVIRIVLPGAIYLGEQRVA